MRKALVIPKAVMAVICIIAAFVLAAPVMPMMSARMFGGGMIDFNEENYSEYSKNRPVSGKMFYIFAAEGGAEEDVYYYIVPVKGKQADKENTVDAVTLVKASVKSDLYSDFNDIFRESAEGGSKTGCEFSGVLTSCTSEEKKIAEKLFLKVPNKTLTVSEYVIDATSTVGAMTARFLLALLCFAAGAFFAVITVQAVKKNVELERIEDERIAYKMEQDRKSGNKNDDGSDKMFGDSDASYGVTPPKNGGSAPSGGFNPSFQSQGGGAPTPQNDYSSSDDEDGFLGGGGSFFGASPTPAQSAAPAQSSDPFASSAFNDLGQSDEGSGFYGSVNDQGGFYGGSNDQGGFYGGSNGSQDDDDDAGFFVRR